MPKVFNWQLNREMDYPYPAAIPKKQFAAVFDLNKCIACQTCTFACKNAWTVGRGQEFMFWNNVETKPYGGYPIAWDAKLLEMLGPQTWDSGTYTGKTIFEAAPEGRAALGFLPEELDWIHPNIGEDETSGIVPGGMHMTIPHDVWNFYLPRICNHCSFPACLAACPRKAIYKRKEDGVVLIDQERCRGYRECNRACPYKKAMYNGITRLSEKCIACFPMIEQGRQTQCIVNCIGKIRIAGWVRQPKDLDPEAPVDFMVHVRKVALPLYPQFGLMMNVYYIPPVHVPLPYLQQMFGPGVERALEVYNNVKDDEQLLGLFLLMGSTDRWIDKFKVKDGTAFGYDAKGAEFVRVPIKEPNFVRPFHDVARNTFRHNIT